MCRLVLSLPRRLSRLPGECWRFVPCVRLEWTPPMCDNYGGVQWPFTLWLDGAPLHGLTDAISTTREAALVSKQPQPAIAEAFAAVSLSPPSHDTSGHVDHGHPPPVPPLPSPRHVTIPLLPPLAAMLRSVRYVRRVEYSSCGRDVSSLLTVLTVLPSFPLLSHFALHCGDHFAGLRDEERDCLVSGLFGSLLTLPHLSSSSWTATYRLSDGVMARDD